MAWLKSSKNIDLHVNIGSAECTNEVVHRFSDQNNIQMSFYYKKLSNCEA